MLTVNNHALELYFPEVHPEALCRISLHREDPLNRRSPFLWKDADQIPLFHLDDYAKVLPDDWVKRGGVLAPVRQGEHIRIHLDGRYPFAVKIASGKINAITGKPWKDALDPEEQDYLVSSFQRSLSGFFQANGAAKKFIVSPLGVGKTVEERTTGVAKFGGIQVMGFPVKPDIYEEKKKDEPRFSRKSVEEVLEVYSAMALDAEEVIEEWIEKDYDPHQWQADTFVRCFIHLVSEDDFLRITGHRANGRQPLPISMDYWRSRF